MKNIINSYLKPTKIFLLFRLKSFIQIIIFSIMILFIFLPTKTNAIEKIYVFTEKSEEVTDKETKMLNNYFIDILSTKENIKIQAEKEKDEKASKGIVTPGIKEIVSMGKKKKVNSVFFISVSKIKKIYVVNAKLIDVKEQTIKFSSTKKVNDPLKFENVAEEIVALMFNEKKAEEKPVIEEEIAPKKVVEPKITPPPKIIPKSEIANIFFEFGFGWPFEISYEPSEAQDYADGADEFADDHYSVITNFILYGKQSDKTLLGGGILAASDMYFGKEDQHLVGISYMIGCFGQFYITDHITKGLYLKGGLGVGLNQAIVKIVQTDIAVDDSYKTDIGLAILGGFGWAFPLSNGKSSMNLEMNFYKNNGSKTDGLDSIQCISLMLNFII